MKVSCLVPEKEISLAIQVSAILKMAATIFKMASIIITFISYFQAFFCNISISFKIINQKGVEHTIKVSFHIYMHCACAKIQAAVVL